MSGGRETARVLLVEDEALIAMDLEEQLRDMGFSQIDFVDDFDQAEAQIGTGLYDLGLFDLNLDGRTSTPLVERFVAGGGKAVILSGYGADEVGTDVPLLQKPVEPKTLERVLVGEGF